VLGHAVLHHLPDLDQAFREFHRVLKPGGVLFFAGEPSRQGDKLASVPKQAAVKVAPLWRKAFRTGAAPVYHGADENEHALESVVDVHAFVPSDLTRHASGAGFTDVKVQGEELLANWFGWFNRTLEASADPKDIPRGWIQYAYRGYILLQRVDRTLLEPRLPPQIFYNLMVAARKPA
jgi:SAM-dependent methyltransferase